MENKKTTTAQNIKSGNRFQKFALFLSIIISAGFLKAQDNVNLIIKDVVLGQSEASATTSITMKEGFRAVEGSSFRAYISTTATAPVSISNPAAVAPVWSAPAAGTNTMNYVKTINYLEARTSVPTAGTSFKHLTEISYFDGLGRPVQVVSVAASPSQKDIIQPTVYDDYGREAKKILPYLDTLATGAYRSGITNSALDPVIGYYTKIKDDNVPFTQITFDNSPLNRVVSKQGPGKHWAGKSSSIRYLTNTVAKTGWKVTGNFSYTSFNYPVGSLYVFESTDEQGNQTLEYKDKQEQVIMKESKLGSEWLTTSYIYDDFGLLRCVISPKASNPNTDTTLCYYYRYDERNRMVEKRIPGAGAVLMVYDERDRVRFVQNALQARTNEWSFTKYDALNRPVITGIFTFAGGVSGLKTNLATGSMNETRDNSTSCYGYNNASYPATSINVLTVTYYDDYSFITAGLAGDSLKSTTYDAAPYVFGDFSAVIAKGRVTGGMTKVVSHADDVNSVAKKELYSATYYNKYGHVLRTVLENHLGGKDVVSNNYEAFTFRLLSSKQQHYSKWETGLPVEKFFEYDHAGRLLATRLKINGQPEITQNATNYNELGEMVSKFLHSSQTSGTRSYKQKIDYSYNIRGWLTGINNPASLSSENDLFGMQLFYHTTEGLGELLHNSTGYFNGNIVGMKWKTQGDRMRAYRFTYDELNRLKTSSYADGDALTANLNAFNENIPEYDKNGNIIKLDRWHAGTQVDGLTYTYSGNQLTTIFDSKGDAVNFGDYPGSTAGKSYSYDVNGNMTKDGAKNLSIDYNHLFNLPNRVYEASQKLYYHYSATGVKLVKQMGGNYTHYISNIVYEGPRLSYIITEEGRLVAVGTGTSRVFVNEYNLKDHLGNTRVTFSGASIGNGIDTVQTTSYYPFGLAFKLNNINNNSTYPKNKYLYNGKELQDESFESQKLDWLDYGARFYDPQLGRFHTIDPMTEDVLGITPYNYCFNNPINYTDPSGMFAERKPVVSSSYMDPSGKIIWHEDDGDPRVYLVTNPEEWVKGGRKKDRLPIVGFEDPRKKYEPGDQYKYYNPHDDPEYTGQYMIPAEAYNYSEPTIDGKLSEDWAYYIYGGPWYQLGKRWRELQKRDFTALGNRETVVIESATAAGGFLFIRIGKLFFKFHPHSLDRMAVRGITKNMIKAAMRQNPIEYFHAGIMKTGYYDPATKVFVACIGKEVRTVMKDISPEYITRLLQKTQ